MLILTVVGGVLLLLLLLLLQPVRVNIGYGKTVKIKIGYLFIRYALPLPMVEETLEEEEEEAEEDAGVEGASSLRLLSNLLKHEGLTGFFELLEEAIVLVAGGAKGVLAHTKIRFLNLKLVISGEEAADIALQYGRACGIIYPACALIFACIPCRRHDLRIDVDYEAGKTLLSCDTQLRIPLIFVLLDALKVLWRGYPLLRRVKHAVSDPSEEPEDPSKGRG